MCFLFNPGGPTELQPNKKSSLLNMKAPYCMIKTLVSGYPPVSLHIFWVSSPLTSWVPGQRGSAECWLSAKDERRRPDSDRKTYPLTWLNPMGLLNQNPTGLIAKMNNTEMEEAAPQTMDVERGRRRCSFQTTFKQGTGIVSLSLSSFKSCSSITDSQACKIIHKLMQLLSIS